MLLKFMALLTAIVPMVSAQGESTDAQSVIVTTKTRAFLSCESGDIVVKVNFTQPFRGLMYAHRSRSSPCRVHGIGGYYYILRIPLKGCGTWQESPRVFVNNITIRFHPALELEEDETKTVVCRYPPPLTPAPGSIVVVEPSTNSPKTIPTRVATAKLSEVEILIIICLLLFLSLLTLGIGIAYFCLKRRNIHLVRKSITASTAPASQITRLSSSNIQPSSLLSSVLGHTVRIPRAIPYSAPAGRASVLSFSDHPYEAYPASTSTESGESSETSVSSSSEDQVGPRTLLSIPKAILRKPTLKKEPQPSVHNYLCKTGTASFGTSIKNQETEDQTFMTVLDPEINENSLNSNKDVTVPVSKKILNGEANKNEGEQKKSPPVYAQIDKNKKVATKSQMNIENINVIGPGTKASFSATLHQPSLLGAAKQQRSVITDIPEESVTSEEITKDTTITTSIRREVTETSILSPTLTKTLSEMTHSPLNRDSLQSHPDNIAEQSTKISQEQPKKILIRDVADIYLTTTIETESRELKTKMTKDVIEKHPKAEKDFPKEDTTPGTTRLENELTTAKITPKQEMDTSDTKSTSATKTWNVVIRQKKSSLNLPLQSTDMKSPDTTKRKDNMDVSQTSTEEKPVFNVMIRTISADASKVKIQDDVSIPQFEMPQAFSKLKALVPNIKESLPETKQTQQENSAKSNERENLSKSTDKLASRTVHWDSDTKDSSKDKNSTTSSSGSYRSSESLRERSSSEVLEVAPTLPSQQRNRDHPMLERSTSEIVTAPEEHVRWIGGVVPVLESLSPEFLANIPVIKGGFFNSQSTSSKQQKE